MLDKVNRFYTHVLQGTVVVLGVVLFWFAFVYYPKIVTDLKLGRVLPSKFVFTPVSANSNSFPIVTSAYRIEYAPDSGIYYVAVAGKTLPEYVFNMDNAKLALKTATSQTDLCGVDIVYVSSDGLEVLPQYRDPAEC